MKPENYSHKILIVDDEVIHIETIMDCIEETENDYRVLQAFTGENALEIAQKVLPDLIITDWEMPGMNGIELIKKLKEDPITKDIPVIMCTGVMTSSENLETALKAGAIDYIRKPVDKIELIARIKANLHLADRYHEIKELNEAKNRIYSIIAHDLRGPIGNMKSYLELILSPMFDYNNEELQEDLTLLAKQSAAALNILNNLLAWANSHRNNIVFNPKLQAINLAISDNIGLLENIADRKNIVLQNTVKKNERAMFDLTLIATVIRNLIANAIKFTPENGKITIAAEQTASETLISVTDSGVGIPADRQEKLFDDTSFITTAGTNKEKGSGLGLKVCKYFIEQHQGRIWVESSPDKGSKFIFSLPK